MRRFIFSLTLLILIVSLSCGAYFSYQVDAAERNNRAIRYLEAGDSRRAIEAYQLAKVAEPDNALLYFNSAEAYATDESFSGIIDALEQAILRGDEQLQAQAYYNLGNYYYEAEECELAMQAYRESLLLQPDNPDASYNLELTLFCIPTATPTEQQQQIELDEQAVKTETPTPLPAGEIMPTDTPSPTPPEEPPPPGPSPDPTFTGNESGEMSDEIEPTTAPQDNADQDQEAAEQILEQVEANQENLGTIRNNDAQSDAENTEQGFDW